MLALFAAMAALPGCDGSAGGGETTQAADAAGRCPHEIKREKCPFCNPGLVEAEGFCGEHGVAEALCAQCRPYLKAAFRATDDWCAEHSVPESQCVECNPELAKGVRPGTHGVAAAQGPTEAGQCAHGIAEAGCPFCNPSLIEAGGFCTEHGVAEALCVQCRPTLEVAFRAANDWCTEHATPESQCVVCNPSLLDNPGGG
jgi:hypothetical protein